MVNEGQMLYVVVEGNAPDWHMQYNFLPELYVDLEEAKTIASEKAKASMARAEMLGIKTKLTETIQKKPIAPGDDVYEAEVKWCDDDDVEVFIVQAFILKGKEKK